MAILDKRSILAAAAVHDAMNLLNPLQGAEEAVNWYFRDANYEAVMSEPEAHERMTDAVNRRLAQLVHHELNLKEKFFVGDSNGMSILYPGQLGGFFQAGNRNWTVNFRMSATLVEFSVHDDSHDFTLKGRVYDYTQSDKGILSYPIRSDVRTLLVDRIDAALAAMARHAFSPIQKGLIRQERMAIISNEVID